MVERLELFWRPHSYKKAYVYIDMSNTCNHVKAEKQTHTHTVSTNTHTNLQSSSNRLSGKVL